MPPKRDPRRAEAFRLYIDSGGKRTIQSISQELGLAKSTVATWKKQDEWEKKLHQNEAALSSRTKSGNNRKRAGYFGNKNASGPKYSTDRYKGMKNALKHGLYEEIKYDTLSEQEKKLMAEMDVSDPLSMQMRLIMEMEVRERRMLHRIDELKSKTDADGFVAEGSFIQKSENQLGLATVASKTKTSAISQIQDIEAALTTLQRQKQAAILALHKLMQDARSLEIDEERLEIQQARLEIDRRKLALLDPAQKNDTIEKANAQILALADLINNPVPNRTIEQIEAYEEGDADD